MSTKRIITVNNPNCELVVFKRADGSAEAVIYQPMSYDIEKATRVEIAPPPEGFAIATVVHDGVSEVVYREV